MADDPIPKQPERTAESPPLLAHQPLWQLFALCFFSFDLYACWWAYRAARSLRAAGTQTVHPAWWAASMFSGLFGAFALHRLARYAEEDAARHGVEIRDVAWKAAILQFLFAALSMRTNVLLPWLLLGPLPVLLVQREINRIARTVAARNAIQSGDESPHATPDGLSGRQWAVVLVGAPAVLLLVWSSDLPIYQRWQRFAAADSATEGTALYGRSRTYTLEAPSSEWIRLDPARSGDVEADLTLEHWNPGTWATVYVTRSPRLTLDDITLARRQALQGNGLHLDHETPRSPAGDGKPEQAYAEFKPDDPSADQTVIVATVRGRDTIVEVIGFAPAGDYDEVKRLVDSVALTHDELPR